MHMNKIFKEINRTEGPLNILCFNTHERYETHLAMTGNNFYAWNDPRMKKWKTDFASIPPNYIQLNEALGTAQIPEWTEMDLVLTQQKFGQYQLGVQIANQLDVPLISMEHTLPITMWERERFDGLRNMRGDLNVFLSDFSKRAWQWTEHGDDTIIIGAAVDADFFCPDDRPVQAKQNHILSIVNDWKERDYFCGYSLWQRITSGLPVHVRGINKGISTPTKTTDELLEEYRNARIFLNTSLWSSCPYTLLEAMATGCAVVTTGTTMLPEIIQNGHNGLISNNEQELRQYLVQLLNEPELCEELGRNARQTVLEQFSVYKFVNCWNQAFKKVIA